MCMYCAPCSRLGLKRGFVYFRAWKSRHVCSCVCGTCSRMPQIPHIQPPKDHTRRHNSLAAYKVNSAWISQCVHSTIQTKNVRSHHEERVVKVIDMSSTCSRKTQVIWQTSTTVSVCRACQIFSMSPNCIGISYLLAICTSRHFDAGYQRDGGNQHQKYQISRAWRNNVK